MTKHLLLIAALATSLSAGARTTMKHVGPATQRLTKTTITLPLTTKHMAKRQAEEAAKGQLHVGYVKDAINPNGYSKLRGLNDGTYGVCTYVPIAMLQKYVGCQVVGMRFIIGSDKATRVKAWINLDPSDVRQRDLASASVTTLTADDWNEVIFSKPYTITGEEEEFYAGFDYTLNNEEENPIVLISGTGNEEGCFYLKSQMRWGDYSDYGMLAVQIIVEGDLPEYDIELNNFSTDGRYYKNSDKDSLSFYLDIASVGLKDIKGTTLSVIWDGKENEASTMEIGDDITAAPVGMTYKLALKDLNLGVGSHTLTLRASAIGGGATLTPGTTDDDEVTSTFAIYENTLTRTKTLLEYYTNQNDYYAPEQQALLESLLKQRQDLAPVFIHGNFYGEGDWTDQFAVPEALDYAGAFYMMDVNSLGINRFMMPGYPSMLLLMEFSQTGQSSIVSSYIDYFNQLAPAFATVNIAPYLSADKKNIVLVVSGMRNADFEPIFGNGSLTVYLTEDGLTGKQAYVDENDEGQENAAYVHDHVLRKVVTDAFGQEMTWNGLRYKYTFTIPVEEGWNVNNMHAVAFIAKTIGEGATLDNVDVTNANDVALKNLPTYDGIASTIANEAPVETFTLGGIRMNSAKLRPGIYVTKQGATTRKVVVK